MMDKRGSSVDTFLCSIFYIIPLFNLNIVYLPMVMPPQFSRWTECVDELNVCDYISSSFFTLIKSLENLKLASNLYSYVGLIKQDPNIDFKFLFLFPSYIFLYLLSNAFGVRKSFLETFPQHHMLKLMISAQ